MLPYSACKLPGCTSQAFLLKDSNPNSYFYRHLDAGEEAKSGKWSEEEQHGFVAALKAHPPCVSQSLPVRHGLPC